MPISHSVIGRKLPLLTMTLERGRLVFFAKAIGETDPVYSDVDAARAAGHPDLPAPPTFLFGGRLEVPNPFEWIEDLDIDMRYVLHGKQSFRYSALAYAGDTVSFAPVITDVYDKKGGALEFVVCETSVARGDEVIATFEETLVVRHPELEAQR